MILHLYCTAFFGKADLPTLTHCSVPVVGVNYLGYSITLVPTLVYPSVLAVFNLTALPASSLPPLSQDDGSVQVSVQGAIVFGLAVMFFELCTSSYIMWAHANVFRRMGVEGGLAGVGKVLKVSPVRCWAH